MTRVGDVFYFLRQIFFPNWVDREDDGNPTGLQKILTAIALYLSSRNGTGVLFSLVLHAFILAILALWVISKPSGIASIDILGSIDIPGIDQPTIIAPPGEANENGEPQNVAQDDPTDVANLNDPQSPTLPDVTVAETDPNVEIIVDLPGEEQWQLQARGGFVPGGGFQNRNPAGRQRAMQGGGACQRGEAAIEAALQWFVAHQQADGGWSFHFDNSCGRCSHSGTGLVDRRAAATALALLSFLGAGHTHQTGDYRDVVNRGLLFLIRDPNGGIDGAIINRDPLRMYSHGLAAIALCEAFAMTVEQDLTSMLGGAAQRALWNIEVWQCESGSWNYRPFQTTRVDGGIGGDISIFSWQLMALKSGQIGGLQVSQSTLYMAQDFLDSVALDGGRRYQYHPMGIWDIDRGIDSPKTCTAIGLLSRMYLGWRPNLSGAGNPSLDDGMEQIARWGPILREGEVNLYYIYHATLALHHYGGEHWDEWNREVRELLIRSQSRQGCESGSWHFRDPFGDSGGRLLNTALATMILATPYRMMPLYREIR